MSDKAASADSTAATLATAQRIAGGLAAGALLAATLAGWVRLDRTSGLLTGPAGILGIVSPVIGYRLFHLLREKLPAGAGEAERAARFLRATVSGLAVTEAAALFGVAAYLLSGELQALMGLGMHMILTGALWPSEERLAAFTPEPGSRADG